MAVRSQPSALAESIYPLTGARSDYGALIEQIGDARYVLLGEATHGTHEFYKARTEITKRLIADEDFTVIAWEADWPDALQANRYVRGQSDYEDANAALGDFKRFPVWMWRNTDVVELIEWLRDFNQRTTTRVKAGVYGLDLYSLHRSMEAVINYLDGVNALAAKEARARYACFEHFGEDPQDYGRAASVHRSLSCEDEVVEQLVELQRQAAGFLRRDGRPAADELFFAEQNARVAQNAERYYRAMYAGRPNTWNLRDTHMVDTLDNLMAHLESQRERPKAIVWAHNSHLGDARATEMGERGELNVGQLMRQRHGDAAILVGFTTFGGTVTAASDWGSAAERKRVRPGMTGSCERIFHDMDAGNFLLPINGNAEVAEELGRPLLERAIGVVYRPETERWSHYFHAYLSRQFDAVIHFDETTAVEPLERTSQWDAGELPETYPTGL